MNKYGIQSFGVEVWIVTRADRFREQICNGEVTGYIELKRGPFFCSSSKTCPTL